MAMAAFAPVLKQLMLDGIMSSPAMPRMPRITMAGVLFLWFAGVMIIISAGFILFAEYAYLTTMYTPQLAAAVVAASGLAVAMLSAATGMLVMDRKADRRPAQNMASQPDIAKTLTGLIDSLSEELEDPIRENPKTAIMIASLAGFLAGDTSRH